MWENRFCFFLTSLLNATIVTWDLSSELDITQAGVSWPIYSTQAETNWFFPSTGNHPPWNLSYYWQTPLQQGEERQQLPKHTEMLLLPVLAKACLLLSCSVLASLPMMTGAGRMARMGLAAASKEGLGLGLLFASCPLWVAAVASVLKNKSYRWKNIPSISLQFPSFPWIALC